MSEAWSLSKRGTGAHPRDFSRSPWVMRNKFTTHMHQKNKSEVPAKTSKDFLQEPQPLQGGLHNMQGANIN